MTNSPLLTIITVCYNRVNTIEAAIESVVNQNQNDLEHLIIDGKSTDGTLDLLAGFPHLTIISEEDESLYDAMNKGIKHARGKYIFFLNSDDRLAKGVIEKIQPMMKADYDTICVGTDFRRLEENNIENVIETITDPDAIILSPTTATLGSPLLNAKFFKRSFLEEKVGEFDINYRLASDVDFLLKAAMAKPRLAVLPIVGHHYIEHEGSLTINPSGNNGAIAAKECFEIANKNLYQPNLSRKIKNTLFAMRGDKSLVLSKASSKLSLTRSKGSLLADIYYYSSYLIQRKCNTRNQRFEKQLNSMSQSNQDVWLMKNVFKYKRAGTFVEIGAYDGLSYSNCALLEGAYSWSGIAIEPNPEVFAKLQKNRTAKSFNIAIGNHTGTLKFRVAGMLSGIIESYNEAHKKRIENEFGGDTTGNIIEVPVRDLNTVLKEASIENVDYLSIDVEGGEEAILTSLTNCPVSFSVMTIENNYVSKTLIEKVEALGMFKLYELEADDVFIKEGILSKFEIFKHQLFYQIKPKRIFIKVFVPFLKKNLPSSIFNFLRKVKYRP